jgi:hypothetical protein
MNGGNTKKSFLEWFFGKKEDRYGKKDDPFRDTLDTITVGCPCGAKFRYGALDLTVGQALAEKFIEAHKYHGSVAPGVITFPSH